MLRYLYVLTSVFAVAKKKPENRLLTGRMTENPQHETDVVSLQPENFYSSLADTELPLFPNEAILGLTPQTDQAVVTSVANQELQEDTPHRTDASILDPDVLNRKKGQDVQQVPPDSGAMSRTDQRML